MKKIISLLLSLAALLLCCACGEAGEPEIVNLNTEAGSIYNWDYISNDGLVKISILDDNDYTIPPTMPVLRVCPKVITADMARNIAEGLFGDAALYEYSEEMSKAELADIIREYEYSVTDEAIFEDFGSDLSSSQIDSARNNRLAILEYYRSAYANAHDEVSAIPCQWCFWPEGHYGIRQWDYAGEDTAYTDFIPYGLGVELQASLTADGIPYVFRVDNREADDFRCHIVSAYVKEPFSSLDPEYGAWIETLGIYSKAKPGENEINAVLEKVQSTLNKLDIGQWVLNAEVKQMSYPLEMSSQGDVISSSNGYYLEITAQPVYAGIPVSKHELNNVKSADPAASNYYFESLEIRTTCDGKLLYFHYCSPTEIIETSESAVLPIASNEINNIVSEWTLDDVCSFDSADPYHAEHPPIRAEVYVTKSEIGLSRVKLDDTDFLLIPTLSMYGWESICLAGVDMPEKHGYEFEPLKDLLVIDLRDGSSVNVGNPRDY